MITRLEHKVGIGDYFAPLRLCEKPLFDSEAQITSAQRTAEPRIVYRGQTVQSPGTNCSKGGKDTGDPMQSQGRIIELRARLSYLDNISGKMLSLPIKNRPNENTPPLLCHFVFIGSRYAQTFRSNCHPESNPRTGAKTCRRHFSCRTSHALQRACLRCTQKRH